MRGELFQHLDLVQVLNRTVSMFFDRFDVYMAISMAMIVPILVVQFLTETKNLEEELERESKYTGEVLVALSKNQVVDESGQDTFFISPDTSTHLISLMFWTLVKLLLDQIIFAPGEAGIIRAAAETYAAEDGQPPHYNGWGTCLVQFGVHQLGRLWLGRLYTELPIALGLLGYVVQVMRPLKPGSGFLLTTFAFLLTITFGFVFGVQAMLVFLWWYPSVLLTVPVMVVERKGPKNAIRRSFELTQGRRCYVVGAILILRIFVNVVTELLENIFALKTGGLVWNLLYHPLNTILKFCLYASIRADTEGMPRSVLQRELLWDRCAERGTELQVGI